MKIELLRNSKGLVRRGRTKKTMKAIGWNTCGAATRAQVTDYVAALCGAFPEALRGVYLHGSLALGSFQPARSDIDLLLVFDGPLDAEGLTQLARLCLAHDGRPHRFELSALEQRALREWRHPAPYLFHHGDPAHTQAALERADWPRDPNTPLLDPDLAGHVWVTRERGVALFGPPPVEMFPELPMADIKDSLLQDVLSEGFGLLRIRELPDPVSAVLNACRTLAWLRDGVCRSKDEGAKWALIELPWRMSSLTARALERYRNPDATVTLPADELHKFADYMRNALKGEVTPNI
jgi:hypothetical protein